MKMNQIDSVKLGDLLEQNIFRHDSLLALPKGTRIGAKEKEYLKDLQIKEVYSQDFNTERVYNNKETLDILRDTLNSCTLWERKTGQRIYKELEIRLKRNKKILEVFNMLRKVDHYSFVASVNIAIIIAKTMMEKDKVDRNLMDLVYHSLIHDIGKIRVSKITTKEGDLTDREFQMVRQHPVFSYQLLQKFGYSKTLIEYATQTHEKYDGTGYPLGLSGESIEPLAQIISLAEMYNALSSFRPHRPAFHPIEVRNMIKDEEGRAFAKEYVDLFLDNFIPYREGVKVELSNGLEGKIIEVSSRIPLFPVVEVYDPDSGEVTAKVNLFRKKDIRIARVLI